MKHPSHAQWMGVVKVLLAVGLAAAAIEALALDRGTGPLGQPFVMGGIGQDEQGQIEHERAGFTLKVLTAAPSGEFLADVRTRIVGPNDQVFFDRKLSGPVLLINLPPGHYQVQTAFKGKQEAKPVDLRAGQQASLDFRFNPE
ncbi:MAG TPA: carboxypeptidase-like regulatory domain-containing protein [Ideonella sp.]|uniref:carboxypeptidase-like regulatory domain-containing protein n=1 Tax=Ideonella sp. TaxID=1929293 RepID=UPI002BBDB9AD|nr:carboxypeptidase-like regulatory domain-containing protein [Ideonella sp.]HSI48031.1 carboxypeptidase-like regulatory domain-containing protein [Ideonella sp.]